MCDSLSVCVCVILFGLMRNVNRKFVWRFRWNVKQMHPQNKRSAKWFYCTLTWWMCDEIKFGVGGRVHFLPFSQLAVISKPSTWFIRLNYAPELMANNHYRVRIYIHIKTIHKRNGSISWWMQSNPVWETWTITLSFLSTLESRDRATLVESPLFDLFSESVILIWPFVLSVAF